MRTEPMTTANWKPLESAVPASWLPDFMHMGERGTIQMYKRRDNRRYLNIDSDCQRFYQYRDGRYIEVSRTTAVLDSLGIRNWDIPVSAIAQAPARYRAASVLTTFLAFQQNVNSGLEPYRSVELEAVVSALSKVGYGLESFAEMCVAELDEATCDRSLKHEIGLLLATVASLPVPQRWVPEGSESLVPLDHAARLWQEFCVRLAAEGGVEPVYGKPLLPATQLSSSSVGACDRVSKAESSCVSGWRSLFRKFRR